MDVDGFWELIERSRQEVSDPQAAGMAPATTRPAADGWDRGLPGLARPSPAARRYLGHVGRGLPDLRQSVLGRRLLVLPGVADRLGTRRFRAGGGQPRQPCQPSRGAAIGWAARGQLVTRRLAGLGVAE